VQQKEPKRAKAQKPWLLALTNSAQTFFRALGTVMEELQSREREKAAKRRDCRKNIVTIPA